MRIKLTGLRMCAKYAFEKPNDRRALDLMNTAAKAVVTELPDITIAYGVSDEYRFVGLNMQNKSLNNNTTSFVFHKACTLFERRARYGVILPLSQLSTYHVSVNLSALLYPRSQPTMYTFGPLTSQILPYLLRCRRLTEEQYATPVCKTSAIT